MVLAQASAGTPVSPALRSSCTGHCCWTSPFSRCTFLRTAVTVAEFLVILVVSVSAGRYLFYPCDDASPLSLGWQPFLLLLAIFGFRLVSLALISGGKTEPSSLAPHLRDNGESFEGRNLDKSTQVDFHGTGSFQLKSYMRFCVAEHVTGRNWDSVVRTWVQWSTLPGLLKLITRVARCKSRYCIQREYERWFNHQYESMKLISIWTML